MNSRYQQNSSDSSRLFKPLHCGYD